MLKVGANGNDGAHAAVGVAATERTRNAGGDDKARIAVLH